MNLANDDTMVFFGDAVKALDDSGKVGGYLIRFGSPDTPDASRKRDFFTPETRFGHSDKVPILYHHGLDATLDVTEIGVGAMKADETGIWLEAQLSLRDKYERHIYDMVKSGKLGWSSSTASHLMRRKAMPNGSNAMKYWPIVEASLTPTPADPYLASAAIALKSLDFLEGERVVASPQPPTLTEPPESAGFVESLKRAESALEWASQQRDLNGKKADAIKSFTESVKRFEDARPTPMPVAPPPDDSDLYAQFLAIESRLRGAPVAR